jgi:succinate dehydrogenase / fumarate reductase, cytochrome b subunit
MSTTQSKAGSGVERPLSPHLQIYAPSWTMVMSIVHRITGAALYFGTLLLAYWLIAAASGDAAFATAQAIFGSILGRLVLFGYTWALIHHLIGGIRFLIWDFGLAFDAQARLMLSKANLFLSVPLTILVWIVGYAFK